VAVVVISTAPASGQGDREAAPDLAEEKGVTSAAQLLLELLRLYGSSICATGRIGDDADRDLSAFIG